MTRAMSSGTYLVANKNSGAEASESYRTLRTNIRFSSMGRSSKVLLVTSAKGAEGKTTTATNLAVSYAQESKKVLLIDGNLRNPSLQQVFPRARKQGLTDVLTGQCEIESAITKTAIANLSVLTAGTLPPNPSEILGSERMQALLQEVGSFYDVVLIDSPAALSVSDAQILGTMVDGVVLVANQGKVSKDSLKKVKRGMDHVNAHILGVVLNNA
ncbi:CpsD/CapB family tyrosine-protein kinase [Saccharibacillus sp. CPCC 101409]|uniref:CpsD/CapB family tyrosine-protein kinase n=1 Tax=Saccharibacillus sp. CPCC 101409 TaxID=3058041 RepID=UPI002673A3A8|nr:CpsD/CapB family tyrosine-protein kinase [Saccharibacillus sp. CPCC 101409]MDO3411671.1 CpsD/CapB family tyrosine-protein kinase [Saccharibacillus sp. CPCC 101409]